MSNFIWICTFCPIVFELSIYNLAETKHYLGNLINCLDEQFSYHFHITSSSLFILLATFSLVTCCYCCCLGFSGPLR